VFPPPGNDEPLVPALLLPLVRAGCEALLEVPEVDAAGIVRSRFDHPCFLREFVFGEETYFTPLNTQHGFFEVDACLVCLQHVKPEQKIYIAALEFILAS
jgi:hypothetical protein